LDPLRKIAFRLCLCFVLLFIVTFPFPYNVIPDTGTVLSPFCADITSWLGKHILRIESPFTPQLLSDSTGLYIHVLLLLCLSAVITFFWSMRDRLANEYIRLDYWFRVVISYYLALQLFRYGFDKIFKQQFYLPEPNTLFTPVGNITHDLLYWSAIGSSYSYNIFMGCMEVIPACLLLFARTRFIGAVMAFVVLLNVVAVNFSFDISVKVYSCFLLLLAAIVMLPGLKKICEVFSKKKLPIPSWRPALTNKLHVYSYAFFKSLVIGLIFFETLYGYARAGAFYGDTAPKPFLYGAYEVQTFTRNGDTLPMTDYTLNYDFPNSKLLLSRPGTAQTALSYQYADSTMLLSGIVNGDSITIRSKQIDLQKLPLLQPDFHWTIDEYWSKGR
jgi:hypothetical protein